MFMIEDEMQPFVHPTYIDTDVYANEELTGFSLELIWKLNL
jgi:hypothetical protein